MQMQRNMARVAITAMLAAMLAALSFAGSASAELTGAFTRFQHCPWKNTEVRRCLHSVTTGGSVVLGSKKVPIVNPVTLQGGAKKAVSKVSEFVEATNGVTLSKAPQPVPGGLAGLVNCNEISNFLLRISCEAIFENGLTGVNSTLELARPASEIRVSELHLAEGKGVALKMPLKARLENPFLGSNCYVGSSTTPIWWELTTGKTSPPPPNESIQGKIGKVEFLEEGQVTQITGTELVDNAWAAPAAKGCGGIFSFLIDPIVNSSSGLPAAAGKNSAILVNTISSSSAAAVKRNDEGLFP
jgi:hypothetical protein